MNMIQVKMIYDLHDPDALVNKALAELQSLPDKEVTIIDVRCCNEYGTRFMIIYDLTDKPESKTVNNVRKPIGCDSSHHSSSFDYEKYLSERREDNDKG